MGEHMSRLRSDIIMMWNLACDKLNVAWPIRLDKARATMVIPGEQVNIRTGSAKRPHPHRSEYPRCGQPTGPHRAGPTCSGRPSLGFGSVAKP